MTLVGLGLALVVAAGVAGVVYGVGLIHSDVKLPDDLALALDAGRTRTTPTANAIDVLAVVVSAGLGFRQALELVNSVYKGPWSDEIRIALRQMDVGVSRRDAFDQLRKRNRSDQVGQFVTALQQGEELGTPIARTLL